MLLGLFAVVFFIASITLFWTAVVAWRYINSPAVNQFGVAAGTLGAGSFVLSVGFLVSDPLLVLGATVAIAMIIPLPWLIFSFDYIGKEQLISPSSISALAAPVVVGLSATIAIFAGRTLPGVTFLSEGEAGGVGAVVVTVLELSQWGGLLYGGGIILAGTGLILWTFQRYPHLDSTTGTVLCTFGAIPWISILFGLQLEPVSFFVFSGTVALGFGIGAIAAVALVGPASLFERVPAAGSVGPTTVIEELEDAVVVTDRDGQIIESNPSARRLSDRSIVGSHIKEFTNRSLAELRDRPTVEIESELGQILFDPTVSELTDQHGHLLGYAIVLRDVTARTVRKQRLEVLNRLLRHNLRNDLTVILGETEVIRRQVNDPDVQDSVESIARKGKELSDLSEKVRKSEQMLALGDETTRQLPIRLLADRLFDQIETEKHVEYYYEGPEEVMMTATRDELRVLLRNLLENAVQHNDGETPEVTVRVRHRPEEKYPLKIAVLDNGPGIPQRERDVITTGSETPLKHSAGVGLWTVHWVTRSLGGKISFTEREPTGTKVELSLPAAQPFELSQEMP